MLLTNRIILSTLLLFIGGTSLARTVNVDCVTSGAAEFNSITAALNALNATGGTIRIASGTCKEPLLYIGSNITLVGEGSSTVIQSSGEYALKIWWQENVTIKDLRIIPDKGNILGIEARSTKHLVIDNVDIVSTGGRGNGISIFGGSNIAIRNNRVSGINGHGISIANMDADVATYVLISGNTVTKSAMSCINISYSSQVIVTDNFVDVCGSPEEQFGGVRVSNGSDKVVVKGNVISHAARGIFVTSGSKSITIVGNTVDDSLFHGMLIENVDNVVVSGNYVKNTPFSDGGIRVAAASNGIDIAGNHVQQTHGSGIRVSLTKPGSIAISGNLTNCNLSDGISIAADAGPGVKASSNVDDNSSCPSVNVGEFNPKK